MWDITTYVHMYVDTYHVHVYIIKLGACLGFYPGVWPTGAWFLKITSMRMYARVCVCPPPRL